MYAQPFHSKNTYGKLLLVSQAMSSLRKGKMPSNVKNCGECAEKVAVVVLNSLELTQDWLGQSASATKLSSFPPSKNIGCHLGFTSLIICRMVSFSVIWIVHLTQEHETWRLMSQVFLRFYWDIYMIRWDKKPIKDKKILTLSLI